MEFFADGSVEVEVFCATKAGVVSGDEAEAALVQLFRDAAEDVV